jgi:hypothetical protein
MALAATNLVQLKAASGILSDIVMYEHHLAARHRSPRTLESCRLTLEQFDRFLTDAEHTRCTEHVSRREVTASLADTRPSGVRPRHGRTEVQRLRSLGLAPGFDGITSFAFGSARRKSEVATLTGDVSARGRASRPFRLAAALWVLLRSASSAGGRR